MHKCAKKKILLKMLKYVENMCQYFSQYSGDKNTMQYLFLDTAISKVSGKKVRTKTEEYVTAMQRG